MSWRGRRNRGRGSEGGLQDGGLASYERLIFLGFNALEGRDGQVCLGFSKLYNIIILYICRNLGRVWLPSILMLVVLEYVVRGLRQNSIFLFGMPGGRGGGGGGAGRYRNVMIIMIKLVAIVRSE